MLTRVTATKPGDRPPAGDVGTDASIAGDPAESKPAAWLSYWGKTEPLGVVSYHPAAYHQIDVAACVRAILEGRPQVAALLARLMGAASPEEATRAAVFFSSQHDTGKFAASFQMLSPEACAKLGIAWTKLPYDKRGGTGHDSLGQWALRAILPDVIGTDIEDGDIIIGYLISAACGHHGAPAKAGTLGGMGPSETGKLFPAANLGHARAFAQACRDLLAPGPIALPADEDAAKRTSFLLAAVINVADWIGSSKDFFKPQLPTDSLEAYWAKAVKTAREAVRLSGLLSAPPSCNVSFARVFPDLDPSPLQRTLDSLALPRQFAIIVEEAAGGGKTEAVLALTARALEAKIASGFCLGLPTTATTDALASRQSAVYRLLFAEDSAPSMAVAHSLESSPLARAGTDCAAWILDDRRKRLLADACVCTVDQALLAAMPARFASVRLFGLLGKLLVLDEVHAFDDYTGALIEALVALHAALGGSVVILSATLTGKVKQRLADAFVKGTGFQAPKRDHIRCRAYPLVTVLGPDGSAVFTPDRAPAAPADKEVRFVRSEAEAEAAVLAAARDGLCVAWIRNTVDQVIGSAERMGVQHADVSVLHSRFPERDREAWRRILVRRFGKAGDHRRRRGGIVLATSIIGQSLDIDFDLVVIDLRPMDEIIQALGRGRRHARDPDGRLLRPGDRDRRPPLKMIVLSPDPGAVIGPGWYRDTLGAAASIHRDSALLWRTAEVLARAGAVRYGEETRCLVEMVDEDSDAITAPGCFAAEADKAEGKGLGDRSAALRVCSKYGLDTGYTYVEDVWDDVRIPTRLGQSVECLIVRREDGRLLPYRGTEWKSGRIRIPASALRNAESLPPDDMAFLKKRCPFVVPILLDGSLVHDGKAVKPFRLSRTTGLHWTGEGDVGGE